MTALLDAPLRLVSTTELRDRLKVLNHLPMVGGVVEERAEVVRELQWRKA